MIFLSLNDKPSNDHWSMQLIKDLTSDLVTVGRELVVVPGEYQDPREVNEFLSKLDKVLLVVASDEENRFDIDEIKHPNIIIYSMYPTDRFINVDYWLPLGYTPHTRPMLKKLGLPVKTNKWFFSGQITHESRSNLVKILRNRTDGVLKETDGFSRGMSKKEYTQKIWETLVVPSACGQSTAEAFRTYEALEAGAIPIPEKLHHHEQVLTDIPFVILEEWSGLVKYIDDYADRYPIFHNQVFAWWQMQKREIRERFKKDLGIEDDVTVIVPTSPIKSNPSTQILEETINSIRRQLPKAEIIITFDGIREEQKHMSDNYQEFIRKVLWLCNFGWDNVVPIVFDRHTHQVGMARKALKYVNTQCIVYVEHDTPFSDKPIEWEEIIKNIKDRRVDLIRFHHEKAIPQEHNYMMLNLVPEEIGGVRLMRTAQWSQRPHISTKEFYQRILEEEFSPRALSMIEDHMHSVVWNTYDRLGKPGWNKYKLSIYTPKGSILRSRHTDGRAGGEKYDLEQIF